MLLLPILPNSLSPKVNKKKKKKLGKLNLRINSKTKFIENSLFNPNLARYDCNYDNSQSNSKEFKKHMKDILEIIKKQNLKNDTLVDIGCGQGDFLELVKKDRYFKYKGFDKTYKGNDKNIIKRYLSKKDKIKANILVLRHVLEHIKKPHLFLKVIKKIFGNITIFIEVPDYDWIIKKNAFFDITYEHVNYFTPFSLLSLFDGKYISKGKCFNGQYYYLITNLKYLSNKFEKNYNSKNWKELNFYKLFPSFMKKLIELDEMSKNHNKVYVWGAATKGSMFILHCLRNKKVFQKIENAIDINKNKQEKYLPISNIKVISERKFFKKVKKNDLLIISNPNYKKEILKQLLKNNAKNIKTVSL